MQHLDGTESQQHWVHAQLGRRGMSADDKSCCRFSVCTESFAQLTCFLSPYITRLTFCQGNVHLFLFDPKFCNSPLHCKEARQIAMCATQISACLAVALSTFCPTHWPYRNHIDLSTVCAIWPARKAWPLKHSKQIAGGTVLKRKTTKDHKGRPLQVRLHNT